ncbi:MAG: ABC transporter permease [Bdellovibrionaceae bacterium]|nr:ABC transporter permease [Pseudobdellovibrionaceae bacterium]
MPNLLRLIFQIGTFSRFCKKAIFNIFRKPFRMDSYLEHFDFVVNQSLWIILLTGIFTGMALAHQMYLGFIRFNAADLVGPLVAVGVARELGPVLAGLIVSARAGGAMAARLGSMRVSTQIDALEVMGVNPIQFLVSPRVLAGFLGLPILCAVFDLIAIIGAYLICIGLLSLDPAVFWQQIQNLFKMSDVYEGLFKSLIFGGTFSLICCYKGYFVKGGAKGVGDSTNLGIVYSMVTIIIMDFFLSNLIKLVR